MRLIDELRPDLAFLDIRMPGASGFDVLAQIHHRPMVIFITAYDEFAVKAFEENAVDYILKPTSNERLAVAVDKIVRLKKWFHSEYILEMSDQEQSRLKVSRNYKDLLLKRLKFSRI